MAKGGAKISWIALLWLSFALILAAWVVTLAGIAGLQAICPGGAVTSAGNVVSGINLTNPGGCQRIYRWWWFIWAFETLVVLMPLALLRGSLFRGMHTGWIGILAVKATLNMIAANGALDLADQFEGRDSSIGSRSKTAVAGFAVSAAADLATIFALAGAAYAHRYDDVGEPRPRTSTPAASAAGV